MRPIRRLLHLLLALAVASNAAGPALASTHACCGTMERVATEAAPSKSRPCHDQAALATAATHPTGHEVARMSDHAPHPARGDGCGGHDHAGMACGCACTLHATTLPPTLPSLAPASLEAAMIAFAAHTRAAPPLPHPLRPPIHAG